MPVKRATSKRAKIDSSTSNNIAPRRTQRATQKQSTTRLDAPTNSRKRKAISAAETAKIVSGTKRQKDSRTILHPPTRRLDVYVFGTNCYGELGLGDSTKKSEFPGPVLNPRLSAATVGVVHIAVGGVHSAALTHDNKILTWGVNDEGALGRDTQEEKNNKKEEESVEGAEADEMKEEDESDEEEDEIDLNLKEATPTPVDPSHFPDHTVFVQLAATDSATFALTSEGLVYGWGTFRGGNGVLGFSPDSKIQRKPTLVTALQNVIKLASGANHVLALTSRGTVLSWGCAEQNQLGRRLLDRLDHSHGLTPRQCALPTGIVDLGAGSYHSFAIHKSGTVYGWGSNNFGQTGITLGAGESDAAVLYPTVVRSLRDHDRVTSITGGKDHSLAVTEPGQCLTWGRIDNKALGLDANGLPSSDVVSDNRGRPRILKIPTPISGITGEIAFVTAGTDHSFAITRDGKAYSWGFNAQHQAGQPGDDEVERPTLLQNKHVNGKKLVSASAGGQFSIVMGEYTPQVNGTSV